MRGIIILIIVMTTLIFIGLGAVFYGIANNTAAKSRHEVMKELTLPPASSVQHMTPWQNGVALYVTTPKGDSIYFVDPAQNTQMHVDVKREKPGAVPAP